MAIKSRFDILKEDKRPRRSCIVCGKALASSYTDDTCQDCKDDAIYRDVKEYILHNDAGEYEVAEKFGLPVSTIRKWIKLGYMEYKKDKW